MKFQADVRVSGEMVAMIRGLGHDCEDASVIPARLPDVDVLQAAAADGRVVGTADKGVGELVFAHRIRCPGVLLLRIDLADEPARVDRVRSVWPIIVSRLPGSFVTMTERTVRARPLP